MAWLAFVLYVAGTLTAFALRTWLHYRRTGDTGLRHRRPPFGTPSWWSQLLLGTGLLGGFTAPLLDATGVIAPVAALDHAPVRLAGAAVAVIGFLGIPVAQGAMGTSWRIGVDDTERTELVTGGPFGLVRNPVFTAMTTGMIGITAMTPSWLQLLTLAAVIAGTEVQVRRVEEPYLRATHGAAYEAYARRTGRFFPRLRRPARPARVSLRRPARPARVRQR